MARIDDLTTAVAALALRLAAAEAKIEGLTGRTAPRSAAGTFRPGRVEPEATPMLTITGDRAPAGFIAPTADELDSLYSIVIAACPKAAPPDQFHRPRSEAERAHRRDFEAAFRFLATVGRLDQVDETRGGSWWIDRAETWFRDIGEPVGSINGHGFLGAVIAHADIAVRDAYATSAMAFGLAQHRGRPAADAWRRILAGGEVALLPATPPRFDMALGARR